MKKLKWKKKLDKKIKKVLAGLKGLKFKNSVKIKKEIPTIWGIIVLLAIINLGLIIWAGILTKTINLSTENLNKLTIKATERQSRWEQNIEEQEKRLSVVEKNQDKDANESVSWKVYNNDSFGFSIQYPDTWILINSVFDPETIVEFAPKTRAGNDGIISFAITAYADSAEASEKSLILSEGAKLVDDEDILINGSKGLKAYYKTSANDIFAHYFFMTGKKIMEISLDSADRGYNKIFEDMMATLAINK